MVQSLLLAEELAATDYLVGVHCAYLAVHCLDLVAIALALAP
jgi:hypothetical protein